jgi:hypothetical protein
VILTILRTTSFAYARDQVNLLLNCTRFVECPGVWTPPFPIQWQLRPDSFLGDFCNDHILMRVNTAAWRNVTCRACPDGRPDCGQTCQGFFLNFHSIHIFFTQKDNGAIRRLQRVPPAVASVLLHCPIFIKPMNCFGKRQKSVWPWVEAQPAVHPIVSAFATEISAMNPIHRLAAGRPQNPHCLAQYSVQSVALNNNNSSKGQLG